MLKKDKNSIFPNEGARELSLFNLASRSCCLDYYYSINLNAELVSSRCWISSKNGMNWFKSPLSMTHLRGLFYGCLLEQAFVGYHLSSKAFCQMNNYKSQYWWLFSVRDKNQNVSMSSYICRYVRNSPTNREWWVIVDSSTPLLSSEKSWLMLVVLSCTCFLYIHTLCGALFVSAVSNALAVLGNNALQRLILATNQVHIMLCNSDRVFYFYIFLN